MNISFAVHNSLYPGAPTDPQFLPGNIGPRVLPYSFVFAGAGSISDDLVKEEIIKEFGNFQSIWIDNSGTAGVFTLQISGGTNQKISVPTQTQGIFPLYVLQDSMRFIGTAAAGGTVNLLFANFAQPYSTWKSQ